MVFSSVIFLFLLLPLVLAVGLPLQILTNRNGGNGFWLGWTNFWLLTVSLLFYAWGEPRLIWVLLASCLLNYLGGIRCAPGRRGREIALVCVVAANLSLLAFFKYGVLAVDICRRLHWDVPGLGKWWVSVTLPLGISFYTFHGISYVVDVWRGKTVNSRSLRDFACYYALFPQLVAGPIVRYSEVATYFVSRRVCWEDLADGAWRFVAGLGKKVLIANQVAALADCVFGLPPEMRTPSAAWLGVTAYALQIYFDFSGYSDMAIGLGRMFGFRFPENFFYPYAARSMRDFWRRWHMTLSRFFRDYLYIPLGGNRHGALRTGVNLLLVFALCGLWHGASWNFLMWGLFHGFFLASERFFEKAAIPGWLRPFGHPYALIVTLLSWVLFRCDSWSQSMAYYHSLMFGGGGGVAVIPWNELAPNVLYAFVAGLLLCVPTLPTLGGWCSRQPVIRHLVGPCATASQVAVLFLCLLAIGSGSRNPFIYYRF